MIKNTVHTKTFSLTFGDVAENHKGMQKIGTFSEKGFDYDDLVKTSSWFENKGCKCEIIELHSYLEDKFRTPENNAYILIIKNGINTIFDDERYADKLFAEQDALEKDTKAFMYGRVVNKHARHNLCFSEEHQEPNYEEGQGRIYAFDEVPLLKALRGTLGEIIGDKGTNLQAEGNYYYDLNKCGIGYHGDSERKKVLAVRLGGTMPLTYVWYKDGKRISNIIKIQQLEHGDIYMMSEKTTGFDWKRKIICTLRHAAGCNKFTA